MPELTKEEVKAAAKEAIKEWLDERYMEVGRWSLHLLFCGLAALVAYAILHGWQTPTFAPLKPLKAAP